MDIHNEPTMAFDQLAAETAPYRVLAGAKQMRKTIQKGKAHKVYLARNADPALIQPLLALCQEYSVSVAWVKSMTDLGHICGIEVGAAAAVAVKN